ncbi:hypothetical protein [Acidihalobacter prosperus]|uniref:Uncharacterized protein n=1 Tax=Acidihalobacter prosperus TaxID=160660 RepID=A0A1A6C8S1_9GAMM|nr:hypothetical protein [Acidihalobacter prosperus]OBS10944.1 hypothetical protein Thpro_020660 [Acidihalobacter prosperus]
MAGQPPDSLTRARGRLRALARREPWPLRLLEPSSRPLLLAFFGGLALGGFDPARHWLRRRLARAIAPPPR